MGYYDCIECRVSGPQREVSPPCGCLAGQTCLWDDEERDIEVQAPSIRGDCINGPRPCPWVRCKDHVIWYHAKAKGLGTRTYNKIVGQIFSMKETCVLDVADKGGATLEELGNILGLTRERIRQIEHYKTIGRGRGKGAIAKLQHPLRKKMLEDFA